jgi:hypothetical protein
VPKLLFASVDEKTMIAAAGLPVSLVPVAGAIEVVLAVSTLVLWRWRPWFIVNILLMAGALIAVALQSPAYLVAAFNPVTLNLGMMLLSITGYLAGAELPSASRCLRSPAKETA